MGGFRVARAPSPAALDFDWLRAPDPDVLGASLNYSPMRL